MFILLIKRKSAPLPKELADRFPMRSIGSINVLPGEKARKYSADAEKNGAVTFTVKKEFVDEILASLPEHFKKLHNF